MGLLDKSLKKVGKTREKPTPTTPKPVGWLRTSLGERASALADKIDLEEQYAKLETLAAKAPAPPKPSLRDRALKILSGFIPPSVTEKPSEASQESAKTERPKMTLRQRAAFIVKRLGGGQGEQSGGAPTPTTHTGRDQNQSGADFAAEDTELAERSFFPWYALSEDGALTSQIRFGEEAASTDGLGLSQSTSATQIDAKKEEAKSPLAEFSDTISRITENLKDLHVQLDKSSFIREISKEQKAQSYETKSTPFISHHVPVEPGPLEAKMPAEQAAAKDVLWPRKLPLDLPARDIKINADGTISVVPGPFQLPYLAEDIAPPDGELSHFTRSLKNAELFIAEGELQLTRIIYERLLKQIIDEEAKRKIRANLEALDSYRKAHDWGNFLAIPPWLRNPWQDFQPPQLSVSEMPVQAKSITINIDKGFFDLARAAFESQKSQKESEQLSEQPAHAGQVVAEETPEATEQEETAMPERRSLKDRRQGLPDTRGEGAVERRSGKDRRAAAPDTAAAEAGAEKALPAPPAEAAAEPLADGVIEPPQIPPMAPDGSVQAGAGGASPAEDEGTGKEKEEENKVQEIRGVLELKTPDQEDTPFLTLTYDFTKIPHAYRLAKDNGIFEYAYYKYKPMLVKAHQFIKRKQITRALNYYRVIREQQIPPEFRHMVDRNIKDITEYLQKYLVTRQN